MHLFTIALHNNKMKQNRTKEKVDKNDANLRYIIFTTFAV